jgi:nucleoside-diphosphate-sugar epimerase
VTGGSGFIDSALVNALVKVGYKDVLINYPLIEEKNYLYK